jgi:hypothetical protein
MSNLNVNSNNLNVNSNNLNVNSNNSNLVKIHFILHMLF